jgi:hypothetical protein
VLQLEERCGKDKFEPSSRITRRPATPAAFDIGGIGISERTEFGACMMGFVSIPKSLLEYDRLKHLAES